MHLDIVKKVIAQKLQNVQTEFLVHLKKFSLAFNLEMFIWKILSCVLYDQIWTLPGQNCGRPPGSRPFPLCHLRRLRQVQERTPQQKAPGMLIAQFVSF